jgi:hypothetical protein
VYIRDYFLLPLSSVVLNSSLLPDSLVFLILRSIYIVYSCNTRLTIVATFKASIKDRNKIVRFGGSEECNMIIQSRKRCMIVFQTNR